MRLADEARKSVVFLGQLGDGTTLDSNRTATGFFIRSEIDNVAISYLVTNKHVAIRLGKPPFYIRFNKKEREESFLHLVSTADWAYHDDETVDLAVLDLTPPAEADVSFFPARFLLTPDSLAGKKIGAGDLTYVVGLFKRFPGTERALAVVHTGHLALLSEGNERVRSFDWDNPKDRDGRKLIKAHLVQAHTLGGASGSPVFIKRGIAVLPIEHTGVYPKGYGAVFLLGVWQASFEAKPDDLLVAEMGGTSDRASIGIGNVVPAHYILEILEGEKLSAARASRPVSEMNRLIPASVEDDLKFEASAETLDPVALAAFIKNLNR